jgi:hypothetical protein
LTVSKSEENKKKKGVFKGEVVPELINEMKGENEENGKK